MTTPKIDIVDEKEGDSAAIAELLGETKSDDVKIGAVDLNARSAPEPRAESARDLARVKQLVTIWKLDSEGKSIDALRDLARASGRSLLDEAKHHARVAREARDAKEIAGGGTPKRSHKATGAGYTGIRDKQTLQTLLAKSEKELRDLRAKTAADALVNADRLARVETKSAEEGIDELTEGFAGMLGFIFDGVSEIRRLKFAQVARRGNRPLDNDEISAVAAWTMTDEKAKAIARPFARYLAAKLGPDVLDLLPLFIGIAGIGAHILHGVQAERLAAAERVSFTNLSSARA